MAETAEISAAFAGAGLDLDTQQASTLLDADIVRKTVARRLEYVISMKRGGGHETELDPLATLLESIENVGFGCVL